jgi:NTP pyrophosphatase (non-canonical NTP hydrolase)
MELAELSRRAEAVRARYAAAENAQSGRAWSRAELAQGFVGDVGALMKLLMAKDGRRAAPAGCVTVADLDAKLAHELADCLWSVLVLARACDVDLERAFLATMDELETKLAAGAVASASARGERDPGFFGSGIV